MPLSGQCLTGAGGSETWREPEPVTPGEESRGISQAVAVIVISVISLASEVREMREEGLVTRGSHKSGGSMACE